MNSKEDLETPRHASNVARKNLYQITKALNAIRDLETNLEALKTLYDDINIEAIGEDIERFRAIEEGLLPYILDDVFIEEKEQVEEKQRKFESIDKEIDDPSIIHIRINEQPLTTRNLSTILSTLTQFHTKCWLIAKGRFADVIEYTQTHNQRFVEEANLTITSLTYNSPADIKLNVNADASPQGIAEALRTTIDAFTLAPYRHKAATLENQAKELQIKKDELETQSSLKDKEQHRQIEAQQAELERQKALLEIEKQKIDLGRQHLALQQEYFDLETKQVNFALETATKVVDVLHPDIDKQAKSMLLQTLIPDILQKNNWKELELVSPTLKGIQTIT